VASSETSLHPGPDLQNNKDPPGVAGGASSDDQVSPVFFFFFFEQIESFFINHQIVIQ
jgi:hypothetical protein